MALIRYAAKFDPFLSLDCAPSPSTLAQSKEGRDQILPSGNLAMGWGPWSSRNRAEESSHFPDFSYLTSSPSPFLSHSSSAPPCGVGLMGTRFGPSISLSDETQKHIHDQIGCCSSLVRFWIDPPSLSLSRQERKYETLNIIFHRADRQSVRPVRAAAAAGHCLCSILQQPPSPPPRRTRVASLRISPLFRRRNFHAAAARSILFSIPLRRLIPISSEGFLELGRFQVFPAVYHKYYAYGLCVEAIIRCFNCQYLFYLTL